VCGGQLACGPQLGTLWNAFQDGLQQQRRQQQQQREGRCSGGYVQLWQVHTELQ
jgi:hypothetical protein